MTRTEGWYPDYQAPGGGWSRYWDGQVWTDKIRADRQVTADDVARVRGEAKSPDPTSGVLITTSHGFAGFRITAHLGEVFGLTVRARNAFSDVAARFRNAVGGEAAGYTTMLTDARNEALQRLRTAAARREANAVIAMRMGASSIGDAMTELVAYGTAVVIEPLRGLPSEEHGPDPAADDL